MFRLMRRFLATLSLAAALLAAAAPVTAEPAEATTDELGPAVGSEAPDFTLETLDDRRISLSDFRGEAPVVLVFFRGEW